MTIARNALYFEDYVLSIQYFNQVINAKPYLYEPYFFRGLAKINLDDYQGAESDCDAAIQRNPFVVGAYQIRGLARIRQNKFDEAIEDYKGCLVITFMVFVMPYMLFKLGVNSMRYFSVEILMDFGRIIGKY